MALIHTVRAIPGDGIVHHHITWPDFAGLLVTILVLWMIVRLSRGAGSEGA